MSLINREELLRRLKLHGRRKDGKTVTPEWMQVAIKEVEHMANEQADTTAYWDPADPSNAPTRDILGQSSNEFHLWYRCSACKQILRSTPGICPHCGAKMSNGEHGDCVGLDYVLDDLIRDILYDPKQTKYRAHWIVGSDVDNELPNKPEDNGWGIWYQCANCGFTSRTTPKFCPHCDALMVNGDRLIYSNNGSYLLPEADELANIMVGAIIHRLPESELLRIHRGEHSNSQNPCKPSPHTTLT